MSAGLREREHEFLDRNRKESFVEEYSFIVLRVFHMLGSGLSGDKFKRHAGDSRGLEQEGGGQLPG
jgi:hypothetical protein